MIQLNPTVGVAPGTTTLALGGLGCPLGHCPPDEPWQYVTPPVVQTGYSSGVPATAAAQPTQSYWNPYQDLPQLRGLRDASTDSTDTTDSSPRWTLALFAGLATFAVVFGVRHFRHGE